jgi:hypothetical protein
MCKVTHGGSWRPRYKRVMPRPDSSVVERGPEKAGVGGSIPSLATIIFNDLLQSTEKVSPVLYPRLAFVLQFANEKTGWVGFRKADISLLRRP